MNSFTRQQIFPIIELEHVQDVIPEINYNMSEIEFKFPPNQRDKIIYAQATQSLYLKGRRTLGPTTHQSLKASNFLLQENTQSRTLKSHYKMQKIKEKWLTIYSCRKYGDYRKTIPTGRKCVSLRRPAFAVCLCNFCAFLFPLPQYPDLLKFSCWHILHKI